MYETNQGQIFLQKDLPKYVHVNAHLLNDHDGQRVNESACHHLSGRKKNPPIKVLIKHKNLFC